jgi:hypothetical protein
MEQRERSDAVNRVKGWDPDGFAGRPRKRRHSPVINLPGY